MKTRDHVLVEDVKVPLVKWKKGKLQPEGYESEEWSVWSFPKRGDWATHRGNYRGNWSPFIPRNLIDKYTKLGDTVSDPMMGSGTTLVECRLMGRKGIGVDINLNSAMVAMNRLDFEHDNQIVDHKSTIRVYQGDARNLDKIRDEEVDLVVTHPPYCRIVPYSKGQVKGDLSNLRLEDFLLQIGKVANECFRILKPDGHCAVLIGDTRRHRHYVPISIGVLSKFLEAGFLLKEDIIKLQHKTKITREKWGSHRYDFYKIAHEHLYVLRKPVQSENAGWFKYSVKWW